MESGTLPQHLKDIKMGVEVRLFALSRFGAHPETSVAQMAIKRNWLGVVELWSAGWMKLAQQAPRSITPSLHYTSVPCGEGKYTTEALSHGATFAKATAAMGEVA
jgi:hypothetical protein